MLRYNRDEPIRQFGQYVDTYMKRVVYGSNVQYDLQFQEALLTVYSAALGLNAGS